jgi:hypothetical protein
MNCVCFLRKYNRAENSKIAINHVTEWVTLRRKPLSWHKRQIIWCCFKGNQTYCENHTKNVHPVCNSTVLNIKFGGTYSYQCILNRWYSERGRVGSGRSGESVGRPSREFWADPIMHNVASGLCCRRVAWCYCFWLKEVKFTLMFTLCIHCTLPLREQGERQNLNERSYMQGEFPSWRSFGVRWWPGDIRTSRQHAYLCGRPSSWSRVPLGKANCVAIQFLRVSSLPLSQERIISRSPIRHLYIAVFTASSCWPDEQIHPPPPPLQVEKKSLFDSCA